jgi:hypothetical protein
MELRACQRWFRRALVRMKATAARLSCRAAAPPQIAQLAAEFVFVTMGGNGDDDSAVDGYAGEDGDSKDEMIPALLDYLLVFCSGTRSLPSIRASTFAVSRTAASASTVPATAQKARYVEK